MNIVHAIAIIALGLSLTAFAIAMVALAAADRAQRREARVMRPLPSTTQVYTSLEHDEDER